MNMPVRTFTGCAATCLMLFTVGGYAADAEHLCSPLNPQGSSLAVTASSTKDAQIIANAQYPNQVYSCKKA
ncbi:hypothetical protein SAMN04490179_4612 [Pseudomonas antarctica]|uniref:Secreted protein n=1 Tax=Pseudomonas antarctica TaxID=219572 RepID=A0A1H0C269_9PSED|nr:hypothetical protein PSAN_49510 [Pseudomonas antarctica]SDN51963.1 hypothetical protein SAMN04490179_4612 [Pseudomonas antarctica]